MDRPIKPTVFARPLSRQNLEQGGSGIPKLKGDTRKPWEGLGAMVNGAVGSVGKRSKKAL